MIYAVGDIHGRFDLLMGVLAKIESHAYDLGEKHQVVFLGDMIDRGPDSEKVVRHIRSLCLQAPETYVALLGNHEHLMMCYLSALGRGAQETDAMAQTWLKNGGPETLISWDRLSAEELNDQVDWISHLPIVYGTKHHVFVHAGVNPKLPLEQQDSFELLWIRNWWLTDPDLEKHVVYGHSPTRNGKIRKLLHSTGLDVGSPWSGMLAAAGFDPEIKSGPVVEFTAYGV